MVTETKKVFALAALIVATGIATVEITRDTAQADPMLVAGGAAGYAGQRIDGAFQLVAALPVTAELAIPLAQKGDLQLPVACSGPFRTNVAAECMDVAYEVESTEPALVVEAHRSESSSVLMRLMGMTVAAGFDAAPVN